MDPDSDDDIYDSDEVEDHCPLICLTKEEEKVFHQRWRQSLIVKLWGRTVGYNYLKKKLESLWHPKAFMDLVALENEYFLVKFYSTEDFEYARDQGPWIILDHYLLVKEWEPEFEPMTDKTEKIVVWVRFPCLPIELFDYAFLKKVGEKIGKPIRADHSTDSATRGRFARICVEVDITKPLLTQFKMKKRVRRIEYEGIHLVCFGCGVVGHRKEECNAKPPEVGSPGKHVVDDGGVVNVNGDVYERQAKMMKDVPSENQGNELFGPWMLARKKERN